CGFRDSQGMVEDYDFGNNPRRQATVTWYGPNPVGGGTCTPQSTLCTSSTSPSSSYDAVAGEYGLTTITSSLPSIAGWKSRSTVTTWAACVDSYHWLLKRFLSRQSCDSDSDAQTCPTSSSLSAPTSVSTNYIVGCDGFVQSTSVSDSNPLNGTIT